MADSWPFPLSWPVAPNVIGRHNLTDLTSQVGVIGQVQNWERYWRKRGVHFAVDFDYAREALGE